MLITTKDFFSEVFNSGFISNADNPLKIGAQMQKVLLIVLKVILLIKKDKPALLTQQLAMLIIRCFVAAGETEWIPIEGMYKFCPAFLSVSITDEE